MKRKACRIRLRGTRLLSVKILHISLPCNNYVKLFVIAPAKFNAVFDDILMVAVLMRRSGHRVIDCIELSFIEPFGAPTIGDSLISAIRCQYYLSFLVITNFSLISAIRCQYIYHFW